MQGNRIRRKEGKRWKRKMNSTTGTSISTYLKWVENEISKRDYGEVPIKFTICRVQLVKVIKTAEDSEKFDLEKE